MNVQLDTWELNTLENSSQQLYTHKSNECLFENCAIHNPSDHSMRKFQQFWRSDRSLMERICTHGVGHPDPDHLDFTAYLHGEAAAMTEGIHGCDGCCVREGQDS